MLQVVHMDCLAGLRMLPDNFADSIVTDPPYALPGGFMGKHWDNHDGREDAGFGYWLAGFTDGEGCFRVQKHERGTHTCAFQIKLRRDDKASLERIRRFVGFGTIRDAEGEGNSKPQSVYVVQDREGCAALVAIFRKYPLAAKKANDFEVWAEAVWEWLERPRGNRWTGMADQSRAAVLKARLENVRGYVDIPWSGHRFQDWCRQWAVECFRVLKPGGHMLAFGAPRQYHRLASGIEDAGFEVRDCVGWIFGSGFPKSHNLEGDWKGWGTALKPAWESIVLARKPLEGTVATNVLAHGVGGLNIDGCRVPTNGEAVPFFVTSGGQKFDITQHAQSVKQAGTSDAGRWPANLIHDGSDEVLGAFPQAPEGESAARFFYCAKASKRDRDEGLDAFALGNNMRVNGPRESEEAKHATLRANTHPTVKPTDLMRYLCRLVTPPGGLVLDPFTGSGSTGKAAALEGFKFLGFEREAEYVAIAKARIDAQVNNRYPRPL